MDISDLSTAEKNSLPRALAYWVAHWDWECPTLFGLEKSDFQAVLDAWSNSLTHAEPKAALAIVGGLRELLYGASSENDQSIQAVLGISQTEAIALFNRLLPRIDHALG